MVKPPDQPETWFSLEQTAKLCERSPGTIRNLVSRYQLPRRRVWVTHRRLRRRTSFFSPAVVSYLQQITLMGANPTQVMKPPR